ncbi:MAG: hypothetical protein QM581_09425 [Pseudomonas sp.]
MSNSLDTRLSITNSTSPSAGLPLKYTSILKKIKDIDKISYFNIFVFKCPISGGLLTVNAYGGEGTTDMLKNLGARFEDIHIWNSQADSIIIGSEIAKKCGMKARNQFELKELLTGANITFKISSEIIGRNGTETGVIGYGHYDYFNSQLKKGNQDKALKFYIESSDYKNFEALSKKIELALAGNIPPIQVSLPNEVNVGLGRFGQVQALVKFIIASILISTFISVTTTVSHMCHERRAIFSTLFSLGIKRGYIAAAFYLEIAISCSIGMVIGEFLGHGLISYISSEMYWLLGTLSPTTFIKISMPFISCIIIAPSLIFSTKNIFRISPLNK